MLSVDASVAGKRPQNCKFFVLMFVILKLKILKKCIVRLFKDNNLSIFKDLMIII